MVYVNEMDAASTGCGFYVLLYAILSTCVILYSLVYNLEMFRQYELGNITSAQLCDKLNTVLLYKLLIHIHSSTLLLISGQPKFFYINIPLMILHFKRVIEEGYIPQNIEQPELVAEYEAEIERDSYCLAVCLLLYNMLFVCCSLTDAEIRIQEMELQLERILDPYL